MKEAPIENKPENPVFLDPKYAARILYGSFEYSQGDAVLQLNIFEYMKCIRPAWRINPNDMEVITNIATRMASARLNIANYKGGKVHHPPSHPYLEEDETIDMKIPDKILSNISAEAKEMHNAFENGPYDKKEEIKDIVRGAVLRDYYYLTGLSGRSRKNPTRGGAHNDPWLSHVYHYALNGNSTGIFEFDQMFRDAKKLILSDEFRNLSSEDSEDVSVAAKLSYATQIFISKHPKA